MAKKQQKAARTREADGDLDDAPEIPIPQNPDELADFVRENMGAHVAPSALVPGSDGPLAYLVHSFFEGRFTVCADGSWVDHDTLGTPRPPGDCVVWANRGGGKTYLGAVATALDLIFKRGIEVRILGGSAEQARRMHEHLRDIFEHEALEKQLDGRTTESRVRLKNGSRVEILSHSERSVRGVRVQKLRCDEVDLFEPALWEAAQLVTRSAKPIPGPWGSEARGVIEVLSTMHVPMGMMWKIVKGTGRASEWAPSPSPGFVRAEEGRGEGALIEAGSSRILFKWGVVDALEHCGEEHTCTRCSLNPECGGRAKLREPGGHMTVLDARVLKQRASRATWESEMLCREPSRTGCVFAEFSPGAHVLARDVTEESVYESGGMIVAGMDFGVRAPSVIVWGHVTADGVVTIVDEYAETDRTLGHHLAAMRLRPWGNPSWIGIDPAGLARNEQTGVSNYSAMRNMQLQVKARRCGVADGIDEVRARLAPAQGPVRLRISPRCTGLIEALTRYHYPPGDLSVLIPEKDGHDHLCDALRYLVVNLDGRGVGVGKSG